MDNDNSKTNTDIANGVPANIRDRIMASVKSGRLKMRPKWYFVFRASLLAVGVFAASLALIYLTSLFLFIARETGVWRAPAFGWRGVMVFLTSLPWILVLLVLLFIVIVEIMVHHYAFTYRMPLIYSGLAIIFLVGAGGLVVAMTPFHNRMADCPPVGGPPPCTMGIYRDLDPGRRRNFHEGTVAGILGHNYSIIDRNRNNLLIVVTSQTRFPFGAEFGIGDRIIIIGDLQGNQIEAFGIGPFDGWPPKLGH